MSVQLIVIGAGGHARVVADALIAAGETVLGFTDADKRLVGEVRCGLPVLGDDSALDRHDPATVHLVNGIGGTGAATDGSLRQRVQCKLEDQGWTFAGVRHPSAVISPFARLDATVQVLATAVVQPGAVIGAGCIVNSKALVEHDTLVGEFVHVSCGAILCGSVHVGSHSHIGAGAVVKQGVHLGELTVVGAGAVVVSNSVGHSTLVGVPARKADRHS